MKRLALAIRMRIAANKHMHHPYSFKVCWLKAGDLLSPSVYDTPKAPWKSIIGYLAGCIVAVLIVSLASKAEAKQNIEPAFAECLNGRGMVLNGELWICSNTGVKS